MHTMATWQIFLLITYTLMTEQSHCENTQLQCLIPLSQSRTFICFLSIVIAQSSSIVHHQVRTELECEKEKKNHSCVIYPPELSWMLFLCPTLHWWLQLKQPTVTCGQTHYELIGDESFCWLKCDFLQPQTLLFCGRETDLPQVEFFNPTACKCKK